MNMHGHPVIYFQIQVQVLLQDTMLEYCNNNSTLGLGYFLATSYNNNPCSSNPYTSGYYDYYYYYSGSG
jgi:hypothetical protein